MNTAFWIISAVTMLGAVLAVSLRNLVHCVLSLILFFIGIAAHYFLLRADFLAAVQILLYVGAVAVTPKTMKYYPGDGGLIAKFSDGTVTDATWKAQTFYIAPLLDPNEVVDRGNVRDTPNLGGRTHTYARRPDCQDKCYAVHYPIPKGWQSPRFNDSNWPRAWEFTDQEIGVTTLIAYTRYPELFAGARWIWTQNLVLDNVVIARKTVR